MPLSPLYEKAKRVRETFEAWRAADFAGLGEPFERFLKAMQELNALLDEIDETLAELNRFRNRADYG